MSKRKKTTNPSNKGISQIKSTKKNSYSANKKQSTVLSSFFYILLFLITIGLLFLLLYKVPVSEGYKNKTSKKMELKIDVKHKDMLNSVRHNNDDAILPGDEIRNHADYRYFFEFIKNKNSVSPQKDFLPKNKDSILFTFSSKSKINLIDKIDELHQPNKSLVITGTYTSSYKKPVGLYAIKGKIINPAIKNWEGLAIIYNGKLHIQNARKIHMDFQELNITNNINDYLFFLKWIEQNNISVFQTHMIVDESKVVISNKSLNKFRRRVIFEGHNNQMYIYDSKDRKLTLFELANELTKDFSAKRAINLDMGTYDYCSYKEKDLIKKCGFLENADILSNLIKITWQ